MNIRVIACDKDVPKITKSSSTSDVSVNAPHGCAKQTNIFSHDDCFRIREKYYADNDFYCYIHSHRYTLSDET